MRACLLRSQSVLDGMTWMREAAEAAARGEVGAAEEKYLKAAECLPRLAAPCGSLHICTWTPGV